MLDALAIVTDEARQGVDARALHAALKIGRDFPTWIREAIERFGLVEGRDYSSTQALRSPDSGSAKARTQWADEYSLSLRAAELIAVSMRTPEAMAARERLIEIQELWNSPDAVMARALQMAHSALTRTRTEVQHALALVAELQPKAELHDRLTASHGDVALMEAGRILGQPPRKFIARLEADGVLFRQGGALEPYAEHIKAEPARFRVRVLPVSVDDDGRDVTKVQTLVTPAGLQWLARRYQRAVVSQ
jgi:anti-repressor protein